MSEHAPATLTTRRSLVLGAATAGLALAAGARLAAAAEPVAGSGQAPALTDATKPATEVTRAANEAVYQHLDFSDERERACAERGFVVAPAELEILSDAGTIAWSQARYDFVRDADAPDTANPSLWQNTQLNAIYGLFEVTEGIYQVRGYDVANVTFVRGQTGWVVFDCATGVELSRAALALVEEQTGEGHVSAVILSHPHVDHYSGVGGVVTAEELADSSLSLEDQVASGKVPLIVPAGFEKAAIEENVLAGSAMKRRTNFQYGSMLEKGPQGSLSVGIGLTTSAGTGSYLAPTFSVTESPFEAVVDGMRMVFQLTPGTEAPAEMNVFLPDAHALWMAENATATMHNLYTLRGAEVRDAGAWARFIMEARALFGAETQVVFQSHNWPHWGAEEIDAYLLDTAAVYAFIQSQTLRYLNEGLTPNEIADVMELPAPLDAVWYTRPYYGTLVHNAKAVYQKYMGWYDANPVHLNELAPSECAAKLVEYLGDVDAVIARARADFDAGEYQWVAQITNALVYADPQNAQARYLCADALEQLGYQAETGAWRNAYLTGAYELRHGTGAYPQTSPVGSGATAQGMSVQTMLDYLAICTDAKGLEDVDLTARLEVTDDGETYEPWTLHIHHGVLLYAQGAGIEEPDATIRMRRMGILGIAQANQQVMDACIESAEGADVVGMLVGSHVTFPPYFNIIEP